ncbi:CWF19-like protein 2 [Rhopilema esculentum]|uniref:CWF19-like protein 2 n=1 Tax=Rhopilema esculentum TaxID=499914 RepID=UPI0031DE2477|eukprot:gene886-10637_t
MAEKYEGSFVSKRALDGERDTKRFYLEQELEKARIKYENEKKLKELQEQRGETTWMLPSLNKRLKQEKEKIEKKKKKKHDKKSKKHKKEKKHKKKHSKRDDSSADSDGSSNDDWVEKPSDLNDDKNQQKVTNCNEMTEKTEVVLNSEDQLAATSQREDWMMANSFLDVVAKRSESIAEKRARRKEEKREFMKPVTYEPGQHPNELNPYWRDGGSGVPNLPSKDETSQLKTERATFGGLDWVKRAYQRAKEQAEEQGRNLEEVVSERFGSMERLNSLLQAGKRKERRSDDGARRGWKKKDSAKGDIEKSSERSNTKERSNELSSGWRRHVDKSPQRSEEPTEKSTEKLTERSTEKSTEKTAEKSLVTGSLLCPTKIAEEIQGEGGTERLQVDQNRSAGSKQSSTDSESEESESGEETEELVTVKPLSEKDVNEISAKILRAELMGNEDLVEQLKARLAAGRVTTSREAGSKEEPSKPREEDEVILTRADKHGNIYPLKISGEEPSPRKKRRKTKKIETHDAKGNRVRYFQEDDGTDLKSMVEEERLTTAEDHQNAVFARLSRKAGNPMGDYYTLDDMFETSSATKESQGDKDERSKKRAIAEHQRSMVQQASCRFCFDNPDVAKHLIISIGSHVYLALPITSSLTEGHCLIIPMQHILASTYLDEDVMQEITIFKKSVVKMFAEREEDVVFLETVKNFKRQHHMVIECIPVPKEVGDLAPIYFKKAIEESESEWSQNKKLVEVTKSRGIKGAIPKGLPYFSVEFGNDGGFAHVIEEEATFQHYFGKEIIGNVLDLEPVRWRKPHKESFQQHKRKVLQFSELWEPFDWTRDLS